MKRFLLLCLVLLGSRAAVAAQSTTQLYVPWCGPPMALGDSNWISTANQLNCLDFVPCVGIDSGTQLAWRTGGTGITGTPTAGFSFYNADGSSQIREATGTYSTTNTVQTITGLSSFTLNAGTSYRFCWCSSAGSSHGSYIGPFPNSGMFQALTNAFVTDIGSAANSCTTGNPPSTTGSLTSGTVMPPGVVLGTATP